MRKEVGDGERGGLEGIMMVDKWLEDKRRCSIQEVHNPSLSKWIPSLPVKVVTSTENAMEREVGLVRGEEEME